MDQLERYRGAFLGLAAGDAVGTTLEFRAPGSFSPIEDMLGGGPFLLKAGEWTDDTSMALCLAESLIEKRGFDSVDQMERYTRWHDGSEALPTSWYQKLAHRELIESFAEQLWRSSRAE